MGPRLQTRAAQLTVVVAILAVLAAWIGCSGAKGTVTSGTSSGSGGSGGGAVMPDGGDMPDAGGLPDASGGPRPAIFSVTDAATLVAVKTLGGQAPFAVHVSALSDVPETCTWQPPDAGAPCNPEAPTCQPDSATPAAASDAIWSCLRQRDAAYNAAMSAAYLGGGDVLDTTFAWDFGDPGAPFDQVGGYSAAHVYDTPGNYTLTLTVRNEAGAVGTATVQVDVTASTRPQLQIASDADLAQLFTAPPAGSPGRKIALQRGATFHFTKGSDVIALTSGDWLTTYGDASAPAPILETAYANCSGCYIKLFATIGQSHLLVEDVEVRVDTGSIRPFIAEPNGVDVVFRRVAFADGSGFTGPSRAFTLSGRGMLIEDVGAPRNADGSLASSGLTANFAFMGGQNLSLYGDHVYVDSSDGNGEPGVRSCGSNVAFVSVIDSDIGGWFGKSSSVSIRGGHNVYFGQNNVLWGVFDLQTGCSPNTFAFPTSNVVVEDNDLQNDLFQINPGVFNVTFRDNVIHRQNVNGSQYPLPVTISVEVSGGTDPWSTDRIELVGNSFLFEPTVGKLLWFEGGPATTRVDLVDNVFYAPGVGAVIQVALPSQVPTPWALFGDVRGNAFFLGANESVATLANGGTGSALSLAAWNQIPLANGATVSDTSFPASAAGLSVIGSPVTNNVVEPVSGSRPSSSASWAASGKNLFDPSPTGVVDTRGVPADITGAPRPAAGKGGWTPGALQAN